MATIRKVEIANATQDDVNEWLKKYDDAELQMITRAIQHETIDRAERRIAAAKAGIAASLEEQGLTLEQVFGKPGKAGKGNGASIAAKYRNPSNPSETWAGRGKQPTWLATIVANMDHDARAKYLESIAIQ